MRQAGHDQVKHGQLSVGMPHATLLKPNAPSHQPPPGGHLQLGPSGLSNMGYPPMTLESHQYQPYHLQDHTSQPRNHPQQESFTPLGTNAGLSSLLKRRAASNLQVGTLETRTPYAGTPEPSTGASASQLARRALVANLLQPSGGSSNIEAPTSPKSRSPNSGNVPPSPSSGGGTHRNSLPSGSLSPGATNRTGMFSPGGSTLAGMLSPGGTNHGMLSPGGSNRGLMLLPAMRMSMSGAMSPVYRMSGSGTTRNQKKPRTVKEYVAQHFWKHYEKYRATQAASIHSDLDTSNQVRARPLAYAAMEYGFMSSSYDVHVTQVLQAQRDREDALPLRREDGENQWAAFLASLTREEAAAIVIQRWWRAVMDWRRLNWPELFDKPLPKVEKPPIYVWSSSESEEDNRASRRQSGKPRKRLGNRAGFGTSAVKPMNKSGRASTLTGQGVPGVEHLLAKGQPSLAVEDGEGKSGALIWGTAAATPTKVAISGASRYMAGVANNGPNLRRRKRKDKLSVAYAPVPDKKEAADGVEGDGGEAGGDTGQEREDEANTHEWNHLPSGGIRPTSAYSVKLVQAAELKQQLDEEESDAYDQDGGQSVNLPPEEWDDDTPYGSDEGYSRESPRLHASWQKQRPGSNGPTIGHLKFWGGVHNPKEQHNSKFFLPHLGQVHLIESEKELYSGAVHMRAISQVLKPFAQPPPIAFDTDGLGDSERSSPDTHVSTMHGSWTGRSHSKWHESTIHGVVGTGAMSPEGGSSPGRGGLGKSRSSLRWINELHQSYAKEGGFPHSLSSGPAASTSRALTSHTSHSVRPGKSRRGGNQSWQARPLGAPHRPATVPASMLTGGATVAGAALIGAEALTDVSAFLTSSSHKLLPRATLYAPAYEDFAPANQPSSHVVSHKSMDSVLPQHLQALHVSGLSKDGSSPVTTAMVIESIAPKSAGVLGQGSLSTSGTCVQQSNSGLDTAINRTPAPLPIQSLVFKRTTPRGGPAGGTAQGAGALRHRGSQNPPMLILQSLQPANVAVNRVNTSTPPNSTQQASVASTVHLSTDHLTHDVVHAQTGPLSAGHRTVPSAVDAPLHVLSTTPLSAPHPPHMPRFPSHTLPPPARHGAGDSQAAVATQDSPSLEINTAVAIRAALTTSTSLRNRGENHGGGNAGTSRAYSGTLDDPPHPHTTSNSGGMGSSGSRLPEIASLSNAGSSPLLNFSRTSSGAPQSTLVMPRLSSTSGAVHEQSMSVSMSGAAGGGKATQPDLGSLVQMEGRSAGKGPRSNTRPIAGRVLAHTPPPPPGAMGPRATGPRLRPSMSSFSYIKGNLSNVNLASSVSGPSSAPVVGA